MEKIGSFFGSFGSFCVKFTIGVPIVLIMLGLLFLLWGLLVSLVDVLPGAAQEIFTMLKNLF